MLDTEFLKSTNFNMCPSFGIYLTKNMSLIVLHINEIFRTYSKFVLRLIENIKKSKLFYLYKPINIGLHI